MNEIFSDQSVPIELCRVNIETRSQDYGLFVREQNGYLHFCLVIMDTCRCTEKGSQWQNNKNNDDRVQRGLHCCGFSTKKRGAQVSAET